MFSWLALLNPLNWIKIIDVLKSIYDGIKSAVVWVQEWLAKRALEKKKQEIDNASNELKQANEVKDDTERLRAKAEAVCKMEKLADPNSTCDSPRDP